MSYDVWLEVDSGAAEPVEVASRNYTSNVSPMWSHALWVACGFNGSLGELIDTCPEAALLGPIVEQAAEYMRDHPAEFERMNPPNRWGDYAGATAYLQWVGGMASENYRAAVRVSR